MKTIRIQGGKPLFGSISVQGSKNAVLPMMAAALLHKGISVLKGCPQIADVFYMEEILRELGVKTGWEGSNLYLDCSSLVFTDISERYADKMRSSIVLLGALLGRMGRGCIAYPGGCVIGSRPIDLHLHVLQSLGAKIAAEHTRLCAECTKMQGADVVFSKRSVGATEQGILAAVLAKGQTCLYNCAAEPEVQWLADFLNHMGARITGAGSTTIRIEGVDKLQDVIYQVPPDRIAAGTYIFAGAITRGCITLENAPVQELETFLKVYQKMGGQYEAVSGKLRTDSSRVCHPAAYLATGVYPGYPTDLQSPLMAVLTIAKGDSYIRETIFEDRYKSAVQMQKMGAKIEICRQDAYITGVPGLHGAVVEAQELRGGAALVLAGLGAEGETIVRNCQYIERGYEQFCENLQSLGGELTAE